MRDGESAADLALRISAEGGKAAIVFLEPPNEVQGQTAAIPELAPEDLPDAASRQRWEAGGARCAFEAARLVAAGEPLTTKAPAEAAADGKWRTHAWGIA